jgi:hypothetical protein
MFNVKEIVYKLPRTRKAQSFTVYPFEAGCTSFKLQSDNYCIIADIKK